MESFQINQLPDEKGRYGDYGGQFVPETLMAALAELTEAFESIINDQKFHKEFNSLLHDYVGRPSPIYYAKNLSNILGAQIYIKREDLNHTGAHKINNAVGQALLAKKLGKKTLNYRQQMFIECVNLDLK